jgi:hypothetical protein
MEIFKISDGSLREDMIVSLVGVIFFLVGLGLTASGISAIFRTRRRVAESAKAVGTVTGFGRRAGRRGWVYCPQVAFIDAGGRTVEFESEVGAQPPSFAVGQKVQIIYQKNNPQKAEIDSLTTLWLMPGCLVVMALVFMFLGLMLFVLGIFVHLKT